MKKLISAATSLAMAATMLSAAVPFATGAATAKSFEFKAYLNPDGTQASTTISADDIAAGDVTIPVAVYAHTDADILSLNTRFTIDSADGDASKVIFDGLITKNDETGEETVGPYTPGKNYFSAAQSQAVTGGKTVSTAALVGWNDKVTSSARGTSVAPYGTYLFYCLTSDDQYNPCTNACTTGVWAGQIGYSFAGETSDAYPVCVTNVIFPKGTPAGTYTLSFVNDTLDANGNRSTMMEGVIDGTTTKFTKDNGNIDISDTLEITIEGSTTPKVTTTTTENKPVVTTTTTTEEVKPGTTTTKEDTPSDKKTDDTIIISGGEYEVDLQNIPADMTTADGDAYVFVDAKIEDKNASRKVAMLKAYLADLPAGISLDSEFPFEYDFPAVGSKSAEYLNSGIYINCMNVGEPVSIASGEVLIKYTFIVDKDTPTGDYEFTWDQFEVIENSSTDPYEAKKVPGVIHVKNGESQVTTTTTTEKVEDVTTTTVTTTAPQPVTTTTTTQPPTKLGDPVWGDTNCDGTVNIADVVILNRWLTDSKAITITDQGKLNADCCNPKDGAGLDADDSDAIIKSIVHLVTLPTTK
jgi:hypothetical protein